MARDIEKAQLESERVREAQRANERQAREDERREYIDQVDGAPK